MNLSESLPLFATVASRACAKCFDTGIFLNDGRIENCALSVNPFHADPNDAARSVRRAVRRLTEMEIWINPKTFDLARLLTNFNTQNPCPRKEIFDTFYADTQFSYQNQLRKFHYLIEEMRQVWLLPIGSRKADPSGYWIITDLNDYKLWYKRATSAPITQLSTIHKNAKFNFPVFAEQILLNFWEDFGDGEA